VGVTPPSRRSRVRRGNSFLVTLPSRRQGGFQPPIPRLPEIDFPGAWAGSPLAGKDAGVTPVFNLPTSSRLIKAHTEEQLILTTSDLSRSDYCLNMVRSVNCPAVALATPKSMILGIGFPERVSTRILDGFRSRWIIAF
jgi:hypothetical protein